MRFLSWLFHLGDKANDSIGDNWPLVWMGLLGSLFFFGGLYILMRGW
jgi:hypothetical protein